MVKKNLKNSLKNTSNIWECEHGCDLSKEACEHLEKLISVDTRHRKNKTALEPQMQRFAAQAPSTKKTKFLQSIAEYALETWEIELLYEHFVEERSFNEIMDSFGYTSKTTVYALYKRTLEKLKKRGFKLKYE